MSSVLVHAHSELGYGTSEFDKGTPVPGAIAYQDASDPSQLHYFPLKIDVLLGGRLKAFSVTHFGIGKSYFVQSKTGEISSRAGTNGVSKC